MDVMNLFEKCCHRTQHRIRRDGLLQQLQRLTWRSPHHRIRRRPQHHRAHPQRATENIPAQRTAGRLLK